MERLLRYWAVFPFSLFVRMRFCKYGTIPVSLIITREPNLPISFYFQPVWMTLYLWGTKNHHLYSYLSH